MRTTIALSLSLFALIGRTAAAQCDEPHYRWSVKTDEALASTTARRVSIGTMLRSWGLLAFTGEAEFKCAERAGREQQTWSVLGWVRRVKKGESDGDWHIELTIRRTTSVDSCIVAEIPPVEFSALYAGARARLDTMITEAGGLASNGDVQQPFRVRFVGPTFFDGEHRGGAQHRDQTDGAHGRCNTSARALWEIHPVYWVLRPYEHGS